MLILTRKIGEEIMIGDNIRVTVVDIDRNKIRIGILAPRHIPILRTELLDDTRDEPDHEIAAELEALKNGKRSAF